MTIFKACGKITKKKFVLFIIFYCICMIIFLAYKSILGRNKNEDCTVQSINILQIEQNLSQNVDIYLKKYFNNSNKSEESTQKWIRMTTNIYAYSAFLDNCPPELPSPLCVKFIGIVLSNSSFNASLSTENCALRNSHIVSKNGFPTIERLPESHEKLFTAAFIFCPVHASMNPTHATIYSKSLNLTWFVIENYRELEIVNHNEIKPLKYKNDTSNSRRISLCVRPFYNEFVALQLTEFLVYYSVMGVDHFIFYYTETFKPLHIFMNFIKFTNISYELYLWDIPFNNDLIHEYGQIVFNQDCLARSKNKFKHTMIVDLDEYIVPKLHDDIKSLVSYLDEQNAFAGSYVIPMTVFCGEYSAQNTEITPFHILNYRKRQKSQWLHQYRSKYIVRPDRVRYSGIHFVWKLENNYKEIYVLPNIALVNHYRLCCGLMQTWFYHLLEFYVLNDDIIIDDTLAQHKNKFLNHFLSKFLYNLQSQSL